MSIQYNILYIIENILTHKNDCLNKGFFFISETQTVLYLWNVPHSVCFVCMVYTLPAWPSSYQLETWWNRFVFDKLKDSYLHLYGFNILRNSIINCWFTRPGFVYAWILGSLRPNEYKSTQEVLADSAQIITDTLFFKY